jgi:hypothetical protein
MNLGLKIIVKIYIKNYRKAIFLLLEKIFFFHFHEPSLYFIYLFNYYCTGDTLWHLLKFLQYIIVEFTPTTILL